MRHSIVRHNPWLDNAVRDREYYVIDVGIEDCIQDVTTREELMDHRVKLRAFHQIWSARSDPKIDNDAAVLTSGAWGFGWIDCCRNSTGSILFGDDARGYTK